MLDMNTQTQKALHKALKVLNCLNNDRVYETAWVKGAINACEEALAQPAQEPVNNCPNCNSWFTKEIHSIPAPSWQGLSDAEILDRAAQIMVERHYKEKNTC